MAAEFTYSLRKVSSVDEANIIIERLAERGIEATLSVDSGIVDPIFIGNSPSNKYEILVRSEDKNDADVIFWEWAKETVDHISSDYYLFEYSDEELEKILIESSEWNELDVLLAEKILKDRNVTVDAEAIKVGRNNRKQELANPESGQTPWIIVGYILALLGGLFGMLIGHSLWKASKRMPDGEKVPAYNIHVQNHGRNIFFIALVVFLLAILRIIYRSIDLSA